MPRLKENKAWWVRRVGTPLLHFIPLPVWRDFGGTTNKSMTLTPEVPTPTLLHQAPLLPSSWTAGFKHKLLRAVQLLSAYVLTLLRLVPLSSCPLQFLL